MVSSRTFSLQRLRLSRRKLVLRHAACHGSRMVPFGTFTVFALAVDLGTIKSTTSPVTWSVGYVRDPSITYTTATGAIQQRRPYYVTQYKSIDDVVSVQCSLSPVFPVTLGVPTKFGITD